MSDTEDVDDDFRIGILQLETIEPIGVLVERREAIDGITYWRVRFHGTNQSVSTLPSALEPFEFSFKYPNE